MASKTKLVAATVAAVAAAALGAGPATAATPQLVATVGPDETITLRKAGGARVGTLKAGTYRIVVRDRSDDHDFRLVGPKVNKATSVASAGTKTWRVKLVRGTYRFFCGPHAADMHGSFRVR
jgi:hypothetical protein